MSYLEALDNAEKKRLKDQARRLLAHLEASAIRGVWETVPELCAALERQHPGVHFPENSISAQCRNLRKKEYGWQDVRGRYRHGKVYEYKFFASCKLPEPTLFDDLELQAFRGHMEAIK